MNGLSASPDAVSNKNTMKTRYARLADRAHCCTRWGQCVSHAPEPSVGTEPFRQREYGIPCQSNRERPNAHGDCEPCQAGGKRTDPYPHMRQDPGRIRDRLCAEEHEGRGDQVKYQNTPEPVSHAVKFRATLEETHAATRRQSFDDQIAGMQQAKTEIRPRKPVPQSNRHHVQRNAERKACISRRPRCHSERREDVIRKPTRQRHVPAAPEAGNGGRREGTIEILGRLNSEQTARSYGD